MSEARVTVLSPQGGLAMRGAKLWNCRADSRQNFAMQGLPQFAARFLEFKAGSHWRLWALNHCDTSARAWLFCVGLSDDTFNMVDARLLVSLPDGALRYAI